MRINFSLLALLTLSLVLPSVAEEDAEGSKDHPVFPRMPNYYIYEYDEKEFDAHPMPIDAKDEEKVENVEGHKTAIRYMLKEAAKEASGLQISRNYCNAITKAGGSVVCVNDSLYTTVKLVQNGKEIWAYIEPRSGDYDIIIVEKQAMKQDIMAGQLIETLEKEGHVALYINFDTGKAIIKPESQGIVGQIVQMLKDNPGLAIIVEGHTDSTGDFEGNQLLSEMRANAVKAELTKNGIDDGRLSAVGFGRTKPIADNSTEEGRAKNRRVEIVKKK